MIYNIVDYMYYVKKYERRGKVSKKKRGRKAKRKQRIIKNTVLGVLVIVAIFVCMQLLGQKAKFETVKQKEMETTELEFPYIIDEGKLEVNSLFQFQGINPDSGNQEGTDIAAVVVKNISDLYLTSANICMEMSDGTKLEFLITELPAGKQIMAFSTENKILAEDAECISVSCDTSGFCSDRSKWSYSNTYKYIAGRDFWSQYILSQYSWRRLFWWCFL